jgi:hypothetical protein
MTNDSKTETGSGRVIKPGHDCEMPADQTKDAVFLCDCGRYWRRGDGNYWMPVSTAEAILRGWNRL